MTLSTVDFIAGLDALGSDLAESEDPATIAQAIAQARELIRQIREFSAGLEIRYAEIAPKHLEVAGVGQVTVKHAVRRTQWDHPEILKRVVALARDEQMIDPDTGEVLEDPFSAAARVLSECASFSWKVTALRPRGIDPDEHCHTEFDHPTVMFGVA